MIPTITIQNPEEFLDMVKNSDIRIAEAIVEGILNNLKTKKKHIHVLTVDCLEDGTAYDITAERKHFAETLEENLPHYVKAERYEKCQVILDTVDKLKNSKSTLS